MGPHCVILPNVRGSTGYGRAFHMMDDYKKRLLTLEEVKRLPMNKPSGKYNVRNKVTRSDGTSH